jgi:hypothetical protein
MEAQLERRTSFDIWNPLGTPAYFMGGLSGGPVRTRRSGKALVIYSLWNLGKGRAETNHMCDL